MMFPDHPRGCGDKTTCALKKEQTKGSPPRMRGQGDYDSHLYIIWRITPADAGTSWVLPFTRQPSQDHPRGCGDKSVKPNISAYPQGSPPRMRGQVVIPAPVNVVGRITPADAGTRSQCPPEWPDRWDHPRGCGDKHCLYLLDSFRPGSPPRMRGQEDSGTGKQGQSRITPADAGTSESSHFLKFH